MGIRRQRQGVIMSVTYKVTEPISVGQFIGLQADSMLGERRPIADRECLEGMLEQQSYDQYLAIRWVSLVPSLIFMMSATCQI